ncbi:MAG TPA: TetR/AcrR family transcriptional regulator [Jiangellaceae bacterium]|nr:TetR/AcrR family transcriptional regulator [Jiangellaceae bacterium]
MRRAERRDQILAAATRAFARTGFVGTGLDDIAAEAGVSRAILYRHFDTKHDLYRDVLDRVCDRLATSVGERPGGFTEAAIDALIAAAAADPDGFRLLFQHVRREPEFRGFADTFEAGMSKAAHQQIAAIVTDPTWAQWASQLAPVIAIESIIAWLDVGQPAPEQLGHGIRQAIHAVVTAAQHA